MRSMRSEPISCVSCATCEGQDSLIISRKMTVAASAMAAKKAVGHRSRAWRRGASPSDGQTWSRCGYGTCSGVRRVCDLALTQFGHDHCGKCLFRARAQARILRAQIASDPFRKMDMDLACTSRLMSPDGRGTWTTTCWIWRTYFAPAGMIMEDGNTIALRSPRSPQEREHQIDNIARRRRH